MKTWIIWEMRRYFSDALLHGKVQKNVKLLSNTELCGHSTACENPDELIETAQVG